MLVLHATFSEKPKGRACAPILIAAEQKIRSLRAAGVAGAAQPVGAWGKWAALLVVTSRRMLFFELKLDIFDLIKSASYNLDCVKIEQGNIVTFAKGTSVRNPVELMCPEKLCDNLGRHVA